MSSSRAFRGWFLAVAAACLVAALLAGAETKPTEIAVITASPSEAAPVEATLVATPAGGREDGEPAKLAPVERRIKVPWHGSLDLDARALWRLSVKAPRFWAAEGVAVPGRGAPLILTLWPTGTLSGTVQPPRGEGAPKELKVRFSPEPSEDQGGPKEPPEGTVDCPVQDLRWSCEVPAGRLDLRLRAAGFISDYRWGADLAAGKRLELGATALRRGASVVGFVEVEAGSLDPASCKVWLDPVVQGLPPAYEDSERRQRLRESATVDERGFFHFQGIPPGSYEVTAVQPGLAPARQVPIPVEENSETQLRHRLVLQTPLTFSVEIDPPLDPFGGRWSLVLLPQRTPSSSSSRIVDQGQATQDGRYEKKGIPPGDYVLEVLDSHGSRSGWEELALDSTSGPIRVALDLTTVEGRVSLGEDPLAAKLAFGGRAGALRIEMTADDEGEFSGMLPKPGEWKVYVEAKKPSVRRTVKVDVEPEGGSGVARVEIRLPDSRIGGETVDEEGKPLPGAMVPAADPVAGEAVWTLSGEDGRFSFSGLEEGMVAVGAQREGPAGRTLEAAPQMMPIVQGRHTDDLRLVLRAMAEVSGRVVGGGRPVPGALVEAVPKKAGRELPFALAPEATTDVSGQFRLAVPAGTESIDLTVLPPGFVLTTATLAGLAREPVVLSVDERGGTLVLEADTGLAGADRSRPQPVVLFKGSVLDLSTLRQWAAINGEGKGDPSRLEVPHLPPGPYAACWLRLDDYLKTIPGQGAAQDSLGALFRRQAAAGRCASGELSAYGELSLALPAADEAPADESSNR
jgi:hypothetical protein